MTALGDFTVGEVLKAADLNAIGAWSTYTPTINGVTSSSVVGRYYILNKIGFAYISFTMTAAPTAAVSITWPSGFTPTYTATLDPGGVALIYDTSAGDRYEGRIRATATNWRITYPRTIGAATPYSIVSVDFSNTASPVTIANGDNVAALWIGRVD